MHEVIETLVIERLLERVPEPVALVYEGAREELVITLGERLSVNIPGSTVVLETPVRELLTQDRKVLELLEFPSSQELLEVALQGPPGPPGPAGGGAAAAPVSRVFTWAGGRLAAVAFADGRSKAFTWSGDRLTRVDILRPGLPTLCADLSYNPDGTLAAVAQSEV